MELTFDFTRNAVFGLEALTHFWEFRRRFNHLLRMAIERRPDRPRGGRPPPLGT